MESNIKKLAGFTLIGALLLLAVASAIFVVLITASTQKYDQLRRDKLTMQMQQLLNAGAAYYSQQGQWPSSLSVLTGKFIPPNMVNPYGFNFVLKNDSNASLSATILSGSTGSFYVISQADNSHDAFAVAGTLPYSFVTDSANAHAGAGDTALPIPNSSTCTGPSVTSCIMVVTSINIPGQNVATARAVNFSSVYHSGACVPAPACPAGTMPQIMVVPVSVSGVANDPNCTSASPPSSCSSLNVYPLTGYTAYAVGADGSGGSIQGGPVNLAFTFMPPCNPAASSMSSTPINPVECYSEYDSTGAPIGSPLSTGMYWRVCLSVTTNHGPAGPQVPSGSSTPQPADAAAWGQATGSVFAVTRCVPSDSSGTPNEPTGSNFSVWAP